MHVAYVCNDPAVVIGGNTGAAVHVGELARAMAEDGAEVTLLAARLREDLDPTALPYRVIEVAADSPVHELSARALRHAHARGHEPGLGEATKRLLLNQLLYEELERSCGSVDVIYERHSLWSYAAALYAKRRGVPLFVEVNTPLCDPRRDCRATVVADNAQVPAGAVLVGADRLLATSTALAEYALECGVAQRKVEVLSCGVAQSSLSVAERPTRSDAGEFVVGFIGDLEPWQGIDLLLEAFAALCQIDDCYRLLLVGDGSLRPQIEAFARDCQLEHAVTLTGRVDHAEISAHLARMDVGVAPYPPLANFYFSPLKCLEYAAAYVPIVASACGDIPAVFPHRKAALLQTPGRPLKIVKHIEMLRHDPDYALRLIRRARRIAKEHTWERVAARVRTLHEKFVASREYG